MNERASRPAESPQHPAASALSEPISQNISDVVELEEQELARTGPAQRRLERISRKVAQPTYILGLLIAVLLWVSGNLLAQ
jgi:uncharacterized membrane protein